MTRVGFVLAGRTVGWLASWTYYRTLLRAIELAGDGRIEPVIFLGERAGQPPVDDFPRVELHRSRMLDRYTPEWGRRALSRGALVRDRPLGTLLEEHGIDVMSHSGHLGLYREVPTLGWVPDLQHKHFPDLFSQRTRAFREARYRLLARFATHLLVGSAAGEADLLELSRRAAGKTTVLRFVVEPVPRARQPDLEELHARYGFEGRYLYLPNQFWMHKNHRVVIDALRILRDSGRPVQVLATGVPGDRRRPEHFAELMDHARAVGVAEDFRVLGLVPYDHVAGLLRESVALLNPSRFEGWSTTVEEAKSSGKRVLLSDIPVHREQDPPGGEFFDPDDAAGLAELLWQAWTRDDAKADRELERRATEELPRRRREFVDSYAAAVRATLDAA
jgi:glycosyltransferase involved in cell wall biosynthesis